MKLRTMIAGSMAVLAISLTSCKDENKTEAAPTQTEAEPTANDQTTAALNPAHGQPGHRCDLPVGAPLNQAAGSAQIQQQQPVTTSPATSPVRVNNSGSTPTKNPPHGQPGHDCAVPVGADLPQAK